MKKLAFLLFIATTFLFTGCINIIEELFLNKDGSGKYTVTMDMSALMSEEMRSMMKMMMQQQEGAEEMPFGGELPQELDTVIYIKDMNPEQFKKLERPEVFETAFMHMEISESKEKLVINMGLDFKDISDIEYFNEKLNEMTAAGAGPGALSGFLPQGGNMFQLKGKKLTRLPNKSDGVEMSEEELSMMRMMFVDASFKTIYHFPKKAKKTSMEGADIDGNTLTVERPFVDIIEGKSDVSGWIKFK